MKSRPFNLSNTILYCDRWAETVDFYRRVLALPVNVENEWFVELRLTQTSFISIADARRCSIDSSGGQGVTVTLQVDDVRAHHDRLSEAGVVIGPVRRHPWGALGFFCRDPEGYRLELWQPIDD